MKDGGNTDDIVLQHEARKWAHLLQAHDKWLHQSTKTD